ncbi:MAG TPA: glycoside hydrolase family 36 N-terminal domain-containing protein, partial [Rubrobacter sp.]|nr:glycoside hydrolase family 36 N-terminal domain-containing protein [Rubrobacter sp.]
MLQGSGITYGLGVDQRGLVRHLYFGASLPRVRDLPDPGVDVFYPLLEGLPGSEAERVHFPFEPPEGLTPGHEYPAWGGMYYHEPCLKATFSDHVRDVRLIYEDHDVRTDGSVPELVVALRDPHYPLHVRLYYRLFEELDLVERWAAVENVGEAPITLEQALSAVWHLPRGYGYRLTHLAGKWI